MPLLSCMDKVNTHSLFPMAIDFTSRDNRSTVRGKRFRKGLMGHHFTQRVVHIRNEVGREVNF